MTNLTNWHYRGRGTCGIYEVHDELSDRRYIGSSNHCEYMLERHRMRIGRGSLKIPGGLQALVYSGKAVRLAYRVLKAVPRADLAAEETKAIHAAGAKATNIHRWVSRRAADARWLER